MLSIFLTSSLGIAFALWLGLAIRTLYFLKEEGTADEGAANGNGRRRSWGLALLTAGVACGLGLSFQSALAAQLEAGAILEITRSDWIQVLVALVSGCVVLYLLPGRRQPVLSLQQPDTDRQLQEKERILEQLTESAYEGVYLIDPENMVYGRVNPAGASALEYSPEDMVGLSLEQVHPGELELLKTHWRPVIENGEKVQFSIEAKQRGGGHILVELTCFRVEQEGRVWVLALGRDISRWRKSTRKIEHLNQLYVLLSQVNRAITHIDDQMALFRRVCEVTVENGGFQLAWLGEVRDQRLVPLCHAGQEDGYLSEIEVRLDGAPESRDPMAQAVLRRQVVLSHDVATDADFVNGREATLRRDMHAVAAVPILRRGEPYGALCIYAAQANAFEEGFAELLESLGEDLSFAITHIEAEAERARAQSQLNKLSQAVQQSADAVIIINTQGLIEYVNPRFTELTGYRSDEVLGREPGLLCASESDARKYQRILEDLKQGRNWKGEFRNRKKNGDLYWSMDTISPIRDEAGNITHFVSTAEDYTELRKAQSMIEQLAFYDPLTELPNRRLLQERMHQAIESARRDGSMVAVMFLDLDKFKNINDSLGHPYGDQLLKEVAQRLKSTVRSTDTVARLGGDEFTILLTNVHELRDVIQIAEKVLDQISQSFWIDNGPISVTTSIGITLYPADGDDINSLLRNADLAMYHAKSLGRNNFQFYTEEINQRALGHLDLERRLRQAIELEQFQLHYQPQLDLHTGQIVGVEALVRWIDENGDMVPPSGFIPLAEETGLIEPIGEWVIRKAAQDIAQLVDELGYPIKVAINLSACQFRRADKLKQHIRQVLDESGIDPALLELELTESMLVEDIQTTIETLRDLRSLGISLAIDDFGTGYSSLNYLKRFPIDILKIDRSFVRDIETNPSDAAITAAIVALGHELKMKVVAEGVENEVQRQFLKQHQCDFYQGYLFSPPVPLAKLKPYFRRGPIGVVS